MKLLEHQGKQLLRDARVPVPAGRVVASADDAARAAEQVGPRVVLKAQVAVGKRGKSGAVRITDGPDETRVVAAELLGSCVRGHDVHELLIEQAVAIDRELYAAILNDPGSKGPMVLFSTSGGMDIEEVSASRPDLVHRHAVDILDGFTEDDATTLIAQTDLHGAEVRAVAQVLVAMFGLYRQVDADLLEINPLAVTTSGEVVALDAKVSIDPGSLARQERFRDQAPAPGAAGTELEQRGRDLGLYFIELDGDVGVLANGAGLTMTTLDVIGHFGGRAANFLEIGGDAYSKATPALELVLSNPKVRSVLVNFCGAFARTDVMAEGVVAAIEELHPRLPGLFTIHGTGEHDAIRLVQDRLGAPVFDQMDDAVSAAVAAARAQPAGVM